MVGIEQLREFCINKQYREAAQLIEECGHLLGFFFKNTKSNQSSQESSPVKREDFSDVEELKSLKEEWDHLCNQLRMQILEEFENIERGIKHEEELNSACYAIDALGPAAVCDVKMWFTNFILRPYQEIFEPGKPDSDFENTRRRFSWLKRTLKEYEEKYQLIFPEHWCMDQMIAYEFCR